MAEVPGWLPEESYCSSGDVGNAGCGEDLGPYLQAEGRGRITAKTDNQGNGFALRKFMTSKYLGTVLLMEMAEELRSHDLGLDLQ